MKGLYDNIIKQQDFGFTDKEKIIQKLDTYKNKTKLITDKIKVYLYKVEYQYQTKRHNWKSNYKTLVLNTVDEEEAKFQFLEYINKLNNKHPYRALLNVKILNIGYEEIFIHM